ncbi:MAG: hypothetical protein ABEJ36_06540 [Candidatus Nanosalina sp.]
MIRKMIREEWRKNSTLYRGRSFAAFPVTVFSFALIWNYTAVNFSTIAIDTIGTSLEVLAAFLGIAVGSMGFSSKDAFKNTLGRTNYLVFSSHTLPVSKKKLFADFLVKDIFYYFVLVLIPVTLGFLIPTNFAILGSAFDALGLFIAGVFLSTAVAISSLSLPSAKLLNYERLRSLRPIADKSILDVFRSSGGATKILFSLGILTGFYWTLVLYFPITSIFLNHPLLSYSVMIGMLNLSIYNWLNRFDGLDDYGHLPLDVFSVVNGKEQAYIAIAVPASILLVLLSSYFYPGDLILSLLTAVSTTVYGLAVAVMTTGLKPNERLFQADVFLKYLFGIGVVTIPLLYLSIIYSPELLGQYLGLCLFGLLSGLYVYLQRDQIVRKKLR